MCVVLCKDSVFCGGSKDRWGSDEGGMYSDSMTLTTSRQFTEGDLRAVTMSCHVRGEFRFSLSEMISRNWSLDFL